MARLFSTVTLDAQTEVAGRAAYQLVVTPTSDTTLVGQDRGGRGRRDVDPAARAGVEHGGHRRRPALEIGFTDVSFATPADSVLAFSAPAGASTRDVVVPLPEPPAAATAAPGQGAARGRDRHRHRLGHASCRPPGSTWRPWSPATRRPRPACPASTRRSARRVPQELYTEFVPEEGSGSPMGDLDTTALYDTLTTAVPEGRLLSSALLSVLVTDDGRVLVGAVPGATLQALAAR